MEEEIKIISSTNFFEDINLEATESETAKEETSEELKFSAAPVAPIDDNENWQFLIKLNITYIWHCFYNAFFIVLLYNKTANFFKFAV